MCFASVSVWMMVGNHLENSDRMTDNPNQTDTTSEENEEEIHIVPDFSRFVAIDIETTGLDPSDSEIIELGAVRFVGGGETETYHALVKPMAGYPERNRRLTGIEPAVLENGRPVGEALQEFVAFLGDDLLISHNAPFDLNFLGHHLEKQGLEPIKNPALCTLHFAAFINPEAPTLQLSTLAKNWGVAVKETHRALQDARMAGCLALNLMDELKSWPEEFISHLAGYRGKSLDPLFDLLDVLSSEEATDAGNWRLNDVIYKQITNPEFDRALPVFRTIIQPSNPGPSDDPVLAEEVLEAFKRGGVTLIEDSRPGAGPVSCSVPLAGDRVPRVVIGIPDESFIATVLGADGGTDGAGGPDGAFYLGLRSEYIRLDRAFDSDGRPAGWLELSPYERVVFARWLAGTRTGRIARVNWWLLNNYSGLKGLLNSLTGSEMDYLDPDDHDIPCFAELARAKARDAGRIIVNQKHLLTRPGDFPGSDRLLDQAGICIIECASRLIHAARASESRVLELDSIRRKLSAFMESTGGDEKFADAIESAKSTLDELFEICRRTIRAYRESRPRDSLGPIPVDDESWVDDVFSELAGALVVIGDELAATAVRVNEIPGRKAVAGMLERIAETVGLFRKSLPGWALSLEGAPARNPKRITLRLAPVEVGDVIRRLIDEADGGLIASDRLLRYQGSFDRLRSAWGLQPDTDVAERVLEDLSQPAPPLFLPMDVNAPAARSGRKYHWQKYMERTANLLRMVADVLGGRTVAAFNAHHELRKVREILEQDPPKDYIVLAQYMDGTKSSLIREYLNNPATLLLGGRNFLDGVDLRPAGFTVLVLVKLPFVSPEEPLHRAALNICDSQGMDGMISYLVPIAAETSNRWIDSLVCGPLPQDTESEKHPGDADPKKFTGSTYPGAVILLDPRAVQNEWGDELVVSLNAGPVHRLSFREMLGKLGEMV